MSKKALASILALGVVGAAVVGFEAVRRTPHGPLHPYVAVLRMIGPIVDTRLSDDARPVDEIRASLRRKTGIVTGKAEEVGRAYDTSFTHPRSPVPIALRIYEPPNAGDGPWPTLLYIHGGGWVLGDLDSNDGFARSLCARTPALVVSVDYRLAPEHRFPAAVDDTYAALEWLVENGAKINADPARLAVGGGSAGGNLSAVIAHRARRNGLPLQAQVLIYPVTDVSRMDRPSHGNFAEGYLLDLVDMIWFRELYVPEERLWRHPEVSPLLAANFRGLAPALVVTAQFDVLHDEGVEYAERLRAAGVPVEHRDYAGLIHGFVNHNAWLPAADSVRDVIAEFLRGQL
jgi:acetyl esterase